MEGEERRYSILHLCQLLQQRLRLLQIARVEALRNRSQQFARFAYLVLVAPQRVVLIDWSENRSLVWDPRSAIM
jgi:hypothetical protein